MVGGAVADLTHLLAELVENAAQFSPPHTRVRITGEPVANGYAIEVEDRGLGMGKERIAEANLRIERSEALDLYDSDRLGLFVVNAALGPARHQGAPADLALRGYDRGRAAAHGTAAGRPDGTFPPGARHGRAAGEGVRARAGRPGARRRPVRHRSARPGPTATEGFRGAA